MIVLPVGLPAHVTPDQQGYAIVHADTRAYCPYLPCHLSQVARAEPGDGLHLCGRFDLKHAYRVGVVDVGVDRRILEIYARYVDPFFGLLADEFKRF